MFNSTICPRCHRAINDGGHQCREIVRPIRRLRREGAAAPLAPPMAPAFPQIGSAPTVPPVAPPLPQAGPAPHTPAPFGMPRREHYLNDALGGFLPRALIPIISDYLPIEEYKFHATLDGHGAGVSSVIELRDGRLCSTSHDKTLKWWDGHTGQCLATLQGHTKYVSSVIELRDGRLCSASYDNTLKLWDRHTGQCLATLKG
ncbi:MAG: hypothetical protein K0S63_734, partial [Gammaproteobacteria bacterium]|nr:hypothetical protein [Gammaproteobacteria bacterium]